MEKSTVKSIIAKEYSARLSRCFSLKTHELYQPLRDVGIIPPLVNNAPQTKT